MKRIAVLGAGAWGTAIACHLAARSAARPDVVLWGRDSAQVAALAAARENARYLPGVTLPPPLALTDDLGVAASADLLLAAVPMAALAEVARKAAVAGARAPLVWLAKGFVADRALPAGVGLAHQCLAPRWPAAVGAVSGPSFAEEVAQGLPTALTVAAADPAVAAAAAAVLRGEALRAYVTGDIAGVEIGGAVKNVLAIAAGASDGLGFGHNARAALITRGLAETGRLSAAMGGSRETLMGLAGLGDLVLTCTGNLSRNRRVGLALAEGKALPAILAELGHVAEGVDAARAVRTLAAHHGVDLPICEAVYRVLHEGLPPREAVQELLRREPRAENG
ncbi:MAG: NAD(P)-dependent glycerol-3-phosphate dehydrogenase [Burkholderiales bacterium]|nr:NAD(P)-dependent glycerol-3-phosphate dehydrogenase [Burkholderiales bacterium]